MFKLGRVGRRAAALGLLVGSVGGGVPALAARPQLSTRGTYEGRTSQGQLVTVTPYPHGYAFTLATKVTVRCAITNKYETAPLELRMTLLPYRGGPNGYFRGKRVVDGVTTRAAGVFRSAGSPDLLGAVSVEIAPRHYGTGLGRRFSPPCGSGKVTFQVNHSDGKDFDKGTALVPASG